MGNRRAYPAAVVLVILFLIPIGIVAQEDSQKAFEEFLADFSAGKTIEAKTAALRGFILNYPDHPVVTAELLKIAVDFYVKGLKDPDAAVSLIEEAVKKVNDPDTRNIFKVYLIKIYGAVGRSGEMLAAIDDLTKSSNLNYQIHFTIAVACREAELWNRSLKHAEAALSKLSLETIRRELLQTYAESPEYLAKNIYLEKLLEMLICKGWALVNLDRTDEGIEVFKEAADKTLRDYLGLPMNELNTYWAKTLIEKGDFAGAMEVIAPDAVMGGRENALELLKRAYISVNGSDKGYEDFLWAKRLELARLVENFSLPDYQGRELKFSELQGDVTVLTFWFPT